MKSGGTRRRRRRKREEGGGSYEMKGEKRLLAHVHATPSHVYGFFFFFTCARRDYNCSSRYPTWINVSSPYLRPTFRVVYSVICTRWCAARGKGKGEGEEEEGRGKKEGNGAIKRQSQASNFQVICFHHAGKMFRFASFCRHSFARLTFNRNPVLPVAAAVREDILRNNYGNVARSDGNFIVSHQLNGRTGGKTRVETKSRSI